jgi:hypothetical protein
MRYDQSCTATTFGFATSVSPHFGELLARTRLFMWLIRALTEEISDACR